MLEVPKALVSDWCTVARTCVGDLWGETAQNSVNCANDSAAQPGRETRWKYLGVLQHILLLSKSTEVRVSQLKHNEYISMAKPHSATRRHSVACFSLWTGPDVTNLEKTEIEMKSLKCGFC